MPAQTIATLPRISALELHTLLSPNATTTSSSSSPTTTTTTTTTDPKIATTILNPDLAIVDVRDADYIGGHIRSATNVPSSTLDYRAADLARQLRNKKTVVFHCMLSQQRGPGAALKYLSARERLGALEDQEVLVLEGGFQKWQERYGSDEKVTEGYQKDLWDGAQY